MEFVHYTGDDGVLRSIRQAWTSGACEGPFARVASGRSAFRVSDLLALAVQAMRRDFVATCVQITQSPGKAGQEPQLLDADIGLAEMEGNPLGTLADVQSRLS